MIDVSHKRSSLRYARATGKLFTSPDVIDMVKNRKIPKGDVLEVARSAGIQAAKRASEWIVFCHSLPLDWVEIHMDLDAEILIITAEVRSVWKTGVEMEAVTAVMAALLNAYDMLKPLQADITMGEIQLVEKRGGKSDMQDVFDIPVKTALLSVDFAKTEGRRADHSADIIHRFLEKQQVELVIRDQLKEEYGTVKDYLMQLTDKRQAELVFLCGSTGPASKDVVPKVIREISDRQVPGISDAIRQYGLQRTPHAMISDQVAGIRNQVLMIAVPGSSKGSEESMNALFPGVLHIFKILRRE